MPPWQPCPNRENKTKEQARTIAAGRSESGDDWRENYNTALLRRNRTRTSPHRNRKQHRTPNKQSKTTRRRNNKQHDGETIRGIEEATAEDPIPFPERQSLKKLPSEFNPLSAVPPRVSILQPGLCSPRGREYPGGNLYFTRRISPTTDGDGLQRIIVINRYVYPKHPSQKINVSERTSLPSCHVSHYLGGIVMLMFTATYYIAYVAVLDVFAVDASGESRRARYRRHGPVGRSLR